MADAWDYFPDAPQASGNDPWASFPDAQRAPKAATAKPPASAATAPSGPRTFVQDLGQAAGSVLEPVAALGSSAIAAPVAGLSGIVAGIFGKKGAAARTVEGVSDAMTYQPRTEAGQKATGIISYPFEKLAQGADFVGGKTAEVSGSPGIGAFVNTAIQAAPSLLIKGRPGQAKPVPKPKGTTYSAEPENVVRAKDYVSSRTGLDWNALSGKVQETLSNIAKDAQTLARLDPEAVKRQAGLESLPKPVPATRGQLTRDPVQLRNEGNTSATVAGKPIRDIYIAQNRAIVDNLDILKGKVSGTGKTRATAETPEQVGLSVQDAALRSKLALKKQEVSNLYKRAEDAGELEDAVSPAPVIDLIAKSPDLTHLGWVDSWLKKMDVVTNEKTGGIEVQSVKNLALKELEDLRQAAVAKAMDGGTEGHYAGKVISAIDEATEGAGGQAYKAARAARRQQALEFQDQGSVAQLVESKSRTDRSVALEDTWRKTVLGGSIQDLRNVKRSLLTGGDTATRTAGRQAWRDVRAQTIQHIKDEATKSVTRFEDGTPNVTPASMERAIKSIGPQKLEEIFGTGTVRNINRIMEATRTVKTEPPTGFKGSPTFANVLAYLEKSIVGKIPFVGKTVTGTIEVAGKIHEAGKAGRENRRAAQSPLDEAAQTASGSKNKLRNRNATGNALRFIPPSLSNESY